MDATRRHFLKMGIAAASAAAAGMQLPEGARALAQAVEDEWSWDKSVCRFCGDGCGIQVATDAGRIVAVKGDPDSPVNRGLLCVKGYANAKILYGADRLTQPLLRLKDGRFDKTGDFVAVSWRRAFDEMAAQFKRVHRELGPTGVGIMGSGQYTIQEGFAAAKLVKAGWRGNNLDPNARHCMASAVAAFLQTFGIDEPAGCYDDIELTDTVVTWGSNMAEMHPMLWARVVDRRLSHADMRLINLTVFTTPTSAMADVEIMFRPQTDLAIWNYIAREILARDAVDRAFVERHCVFATGPADIGFAMHEAERDTRTRQRSVQLTREEAILQRRDPGAADPVTQATSGQAGQHWLISLDDFQRAVEPYTLDAVGDLARGNSDESLNEFKAKLVQLADVYADRARKVVSFWSMGFNQHTRGTWVNEQAYMAHLLTGKFATPGNSAFSLTGQPSACGTAREVGTFANRLPADMVVDNPAHRARAEEVWRLPTGTINPQPGSDITRMMRDLEDGRLKWLWVQVNNPFQATANASHWIEAARRNDAFVVVSDACPGISCKVADLILPSAMIFEKWGGYGNSERRTQMWRQQVPAPGEARSDLWQILEFSKQLTLGEMWGEQPVPALKADGFVDGRLPSVLDRIGSLGYRPESTLSTRCCSQPTPTAGWPGRTRWPKATRTTPSLIWAKPGSPRRRSSRSTRRSGARMGTTWRPLTSTWPTT